MVITKLAVTCLGMKLFLCLITNHTMEECGTVEVLCYALLSSLQSTLWRNERLEVSCYVFSSASSSSSGSTPRLFGHWGRSYGSVMWVSQIISACYLSTIHFPLESSVPVFWILWFYFQFFSFMYMKSWSPVLWNSIILYMLSWYSFFALSVALSLFLRLLYFFLLSFPSFIHFIDHILWNPWLSSFPFYCLNPVTHSI